MVETGGVAQADGVAGREQTEVAVGGDDAVLVEQGELAARLQYALDDEHDIRPTGVVFVEEQRHRSLDRPGEQAFTELGDLATVLHDDGVATYEVYAADMAVEVDADEGPVEARCDLFDVGRLTGPVVALDHDPPVVGEAGQDGKRGLRVEVVGRVDLRDILRALAERRDGHVDRHPELSCRDTAVGGEGEKRVGVITHRAFYWAVIALNGDAILPSIPTRSPNS